MTVKLIYTFITYKDGWKSRLNRKMDNYFTVGYASYRWNWIKLIRFRLLCVPTSYSGGGIQKTNWLRPEIRPRTALMSVCLSLRAAASRLHPTAAPRFAADPRPHTTLSAEATTSPTNTIVLILATKGCSITFISSKCTYKFYCFKCYW